MGKRRARYGSLFDPFPLSVHFIFRQARRPVEEHPVPFISLLFFRPHPPASLFLRGIRRDTGVVFSYRDRIYIGDIILDDVVIRYAGIHDAAFDVNCGERRSRFCFIPFAVLIATKGRADLRLLSHDTRTL